MTNLLVGKEASYDGATLKVSVSRPGRGILCLSSFIWSGQGVAWVFVCGVVCPGVLLGIGFVG